MTLRTSGFDNHSVICFLPLPFSNGCVHCKNYISYFISSPQVYIPQQFYKYIWPLLYNTFWLPACIRDLFYNILSTPTLCPYLTFFLQYQTNNIILISHRPPKKNIKAQNLLDGYPRAILFIPARSALMVAESCVQLWFSTRVQRASSSGWPTSCMRAAGLDLLRLPTSPSTSICWVHFNMSSHRKPKPATRSLSNDMTNCWSFQPWHPNSLNQMISKMKRPNWLKHTIKASIQMGITWPNQRQPGQMLKNKIIVLTCFQLCGY